MRLKPCEIATSTIGLIRIDCLRCAGLSSGSCAEEADKRALTLLDLGSTNTLPCMTPEKLKQRRKDLGLTPEELAEMLGVHFVTVYRWESGDRTIPPFLHLALDMLEHNQNEAKKPKKKT